MCAVQYCAVVYSTELYLEPEGYKAEVENWNGIQSFQLVKTAGFSPQSKSRYSHKNGRRPSCVPPLKSHLETTSTLHSWRQLATAGDSWREAWRQLAKGGGDVCHTCLSLAVISCGRPSSVRSAAKKTAMKGERAELQEKGQPRERGKENQDTARTLWEQGALGAGGKGGVAAVGKGATWAAEHRPGPRRGEGWRRRCLRWSLSCSKSRTWQPSQRGETPRRGSEQSYPEPGESNMMLAACPPRKGTRLSLALPLSPPPPLSHPLSPLTPPSLSLTRSGGQAPRAGTQVRM